ncbi:hypothetical protein ACQRB4_04840 [Peptoniphilaceae bacterium SGI.097]
MRYDQTITLIEKGEEKYDPALGRRTSPDSVSRSVSAMISDWNMEEQARLYGKVWQHAIVARIKGHDPKTYHLLKTGKRTYVIEQIHRYREETIYWGVVR